MTTAERVRAGFFPGRRFYAFAWPHEVAPSAFHRRRGVSVEVLYGPYRPGDRPHPVMGTARGQQRRRRRKRWPAR